MTDYALRCDCALADSFVQQNLSLPGTFYVQADVGVPTSTLAALQAASDFASAALIDIDSSGPESAGIGLGDGSLSGSLDSPTTVNSPGFGVTSPNIFPADELVTVIAHYDGTDVHWTVNGTAVFAPALGGTPLGHLEFGGLGSDGVTGELYYVTNVKAGTTLGGTDLFADDFSSGDTSAWTITSGDATVVANPFPTVPFVAYATTADLFRVIRINSPTAAQVIAAQGDLDTASLEINAELDWADDHADPTPQQLELMKGVCIDRAADLWRHRESAAGILGIVDESIPTTPGRYSWARYVARLSVLKDQWGVA